MHRSFQAKRSASGGRVPGHGFPSAGLRRGSGRGSGKALVAALLGMTVALTACAGPGATANGSAPGSGAAQGPTRTLTMVVRYEVTDLAPKIPGSSSPIITKRVFNAFPAFVDSTGSPQPYLIEALPRLNTDTWRVFPDGRMETVYRLRPGLTWHDGRPLTAQDFVFAFRVYTAPGLGVFRPTPQDQMDSASALDLQTLQIRWSSPYPQADVLKDSDFDPLPRHLLEEPFASFEQDPGAREAFLGLRFWTIEYVGAGPYRLEHWEPGSHLEGMAFEGHALGRARIDRVVMRIIGDENSTLSNVLAGAVDFTADFTLRVEHGLVLRREWAAAQRGTVLFKRSGPVTLIAQMRPEYVEHPAQLDAPVRRALAHALDRAGLNDGLFEGQGFVDETLVPVAEAYFSDVDRAIAKYPYNPGRAEELMAEAGFSKDRGGFFADPSGVRFTTDVRVTAGPEFERAQAIVVDGWRRAGIEAKGSVLPAAQARDVEARQTFPGLASRGGGLTEGDLISAAIGSAANRWVGGNRGGWSNPDYDRVFDAFRTTLDASERVRQLVQMHRLASEQLPIFKLYDAIQINTYAVSLRGPERATGGLPHWNVHEWELG